MIREKKIEGQVNRTQQDCNLSGQRVVCQYVYRDIRSLTLNNFMRSEVQIEVSNGYEREREKKRNETRQGRNKLSH